MNVLYDSGIRGKLYRLWFLLNSDSQIRVKTSVGVTEVAATGENVAQGSIGGGLVSALNLSETMTDYFSRSDSDISYGLVRTNPILYQDDSARFSSSI